MIPNHKDLANIFPAPEGLLGRVGKADILDEVLIDDGLQDDVHDGQLLNEVDEGCLLFL